MLELAYFLGCPVCKCLGARSAGASSGLQQVQQGPSLQQWQDALSEHRAQVPGQTRDHRHVPVRALGLTGYLHHEGHDGRHVRLHERHIRSYLMIKDFGLVNIFRYSILMVLFRGEYFYDYSLNELVTKYL